MIDDSVTINYAYFIILLYLAKIQEEFQQTENKLKDKNML